MFFVAQFARSLICAALVPAGIFAMLAPAAAADVCRPVLTKPIIVASPKQRLAAAAKASPPIESGFDWPDTPLGIIKTATGYEFFGSDGGYHGAQPSGSGRFGNDKYGSIVATAGTLDDPLGSGAPLDTSIAANPDPSVNPNYWSYRYMGSGPVFQIPAGMPGAGYLLATYHAELPDDSLYAVLGLAASSDHGAHWTDLGEIVRLNQAYAVGLDGFEIGDGPLVLSPDGKYFNVYFPDWIANGTPHATTATHVSVARALASSVLNAAFGPRPHAHPFEKYYAGRWDLQPGLGGASTDLVPQTAVNGYIDVHYDSALGRYVMILSNDTAFGYAESSDGLTWTVPISLGNFNTIAAYPTAVGIGPDPHVLGKSFYVYFTHLPANGAGWTGGSLQRFTITCS